MNGGLSAQYARARDRQADALADQYARARSMQADALDDDIAATGKLRQTYALAREQRG